MNKKKSKLELELNNKAEFLKKTNKGGNIIYRFSADECPALMNEVGRLRELSFGNIGGGTGKEIDIDIYDSWFDQLIIWCPKERKIIGGYRIQKMKILPFEWSPLNHFFLFSVEFISDYAPKAVELGRSFIIPERQKSVFSLDNLFEAIGAWISKDRSLKYLVGKITIYPKDSFGNAKDLSVIYEAINKHFASKTDLIMPRKEFFLDRDFPESGKLEGNNLKKNLSILMRKYNAPQLLSVYAGLSPSMKTFGTIIHPEFGDAEETAMSITIPDIYPNIRERYNL